MLVETQDAQPSSDESIHDLGQWMHPLIGASVRHFAVAGVGGGVIPDLCLAAVEVGIPKVQRICVLVERVHHWMAITDIERSATTEESGNLRCPSV